MMKALIQGLPKGFVYGCAQGTLVGVEAGFSHTVADMTCAQVSGGGLARCSKSISLLPWLQMLYLTESTGAGAICLTVQHFSCSRRAVGRAVPRATLLHRQHRRLSHLPLGPMSLYRGQVDPVWPSCTHL